MAGLGPAIHAGDDAVTITGRTACRTVHVEGRVEPGHDGIGG